ncbi:MAG: c-type cytochrome [Planctomycetota bacterium]
MNKDSGQRLLTWLAIAATVLTCLYGCADMAAQMSPAERLYRAKCSSCHNVIMPGAHAEQSWRAHIDHYGRHLTEEQRQTILQYVSPAP